MADFINTVETVGDDALIDSIIDRTITEFNDDSIETVGARAFYECTALEIVDLPAVKAIGDRAFDGCTKLSSIRMPALEILNAYAPFQKSSVSKAVFPNLKELSGYSFLGMSELVSIDFPMLSSIGGWVFQRCSKLKAVIIRSDSVCQCSYDGSMFKSTPIASGTGYIYVPADLVDDYKAATNWSTYGDQFRALEDYTVDGTVTGDLDETKI